MHPYNQYFSLTENISEKEFQCLLADKKIWVTHAIMTGVKAAAAMNKHVSEFDVGERKYRGHIVANNIEHAERIAQLRGFGEEVMGCMGGAIPMASEMINPCNTSKNKN